MHDSPDGAEPDAYRSVSNTGLKDRIGSTRLSLNLSRPYSGGCFAEEGAAEEERLPSRLT